MSVCHVAQAIPVDVNDAPAEGAQTRINTDHPHRLMPAAHLLLLFCSTSTKREQKPRLMPKDDPARRDALFATCL